MDFKKLQNGSDIRWPGWCISSCADIPDSASILLGSEGAAVAAAAEEGAEMAAEGDAECSYVSLQFKKLLIIISQFVE